MTSPQYEIAYAAFMAYWEDLPPHPFEFYDAAEQRRWHRAARAVVREVESCFQRNWPNARIEGHSDKDFVAEVSERYQ